jgi:predicted PurR-regulated permease PerM
VIVISVIADTFIKPVIIDFVNKRLIGKQSKMNSLIIFFAIVAGLSTHGFWGMILGPAVTALFIAILSVYGSLRNSNI